MLRRPRLSLANKLQLLISLAVVLMLGVAGAIVWQRMQDLAEATPLRRATDMADAYLTDQIRIGGLMSHPALAAEGLPPDADIEITLIDIEDFGLVVPRSQFLSRAVDRFQTRQDVKAVYSQTHDEAGEPYLRYARAVRKSDLAALEGGATTGFAPQLDTSATANPLQKVLLIQLRDRDAASQEAVNLIYLLGALLAALLVALVCFWLIVSKVVLRPVRLMRHYAEQVTAGDVNIRADISTGDEYQQFAEMFNALLERWKNSDNELRTANKSLDLKLGQLAESNVALYEANKVKGEFLANVSHELRTPLNSIVGFAEVLQETLTGDDPADEKRRRYLQNIITSSKRLLDLINDLLDLAKIEAGRLELRVAPVSIADTCEGLITLIRPMAERVGVNLRQRVQINLPMVETDAGRLQQIVFNFLSNAVKFTPQGGSVTLVAELVEPRGRKQEPKISISVTDTGPGIAPQDHRRVFEKFTQLDASHTREQSGTGLGLTICQELAELLMGEIELESEPGEGATFAIKIPLSIKQRSVPLMPDLADHAAS